MQQVIFQKITQRLDSEGVTYRKILDHEPTLTSVDSARVRGERQEIGGKALLIKVDDEFKMFVLSSVLKFDSKAVKKHFAAKRIRFASREKLEEMTGLVPGCVPPFGEPILPFPLYLDPTIIQYDVIGFNAGSLTDSVIMPMVDYLRLAKPVQFTFGKGE